MNDYRLAGETVIEAGSLVLRRSAADVKIRRRSRGLSRTADGSRSAGREFGERGGATGDTVTKDGAVQGEESVE